MVTLTDLPNELLYLIHSYVDLLWRKGSKQGYMPSFLVPDYTLAWVNRRLRQLFWPTEFTIGTIVHLRHARSLFCTYPDLAAKVVSINFRWGVSRYDEFCPTFQDKLQPWRPWNALDLAFKDRTKLVKQPALSSSHHRDGHFCKIGTDGDDSIDPSYSDEGKRHFPDAIDGCMLCQVAKKRGIKDIWLSNGVIYGYPDDYYDAEARTYPTEDAIYRLSGDKFVCGYGRVNLGRGPDCKGLDPEVTSPAVFFEYLEDLFGALVNLRNFFWMSNVTSIPKAVVDKLGELESLDFFGLLLEHEEDRLEEYYEVLFKRAKAIFVQFNGGYEQGILSLSDAEPRTNIATLYKLLLGAQHARHLFISARSTFATPELLPLFARLDSLTILRKKALDSNDKTSQFYRACASLHPRLCSIKYRNVDDGDICKLARERVFEPFRDILLQRNDLRTKIVESFNCSSRTTEEPPDLFMLDPPHDAFYESVHRQGRRLGPESRFEPERYLDAEKE
ncbi:hypothetical protein FA10DRAFT_270000 [Acaromyces ingoldii]|uniref:Uncharacterized protein n=1 Tax=Acaromyces ingoldii TaxID=215250 RepID=A0A316YDK0_9BASI|nr:hypothetical protein FA10DRAFT_270000 [Acaromyces ingoldii]PWN86924.1 hypothetical protein FA10DRAFT_270000 [Acaromyces ingoldii]